MATSKLARLAGPFAALILLLATATSVLGTAAVPIVAGVNTGPGAVQSCGLVPLDIELVIDRSGSMENQSSGDPARSRMEWAKDAVKDLVDLLDLPENGGVGGVSGLHHVGVSSFGGTTATQNIALGTSNAAAVKDAIDLIVGSDNTPLKVGMAKAVTEMNLGARNAVGGAVQRVMILLSDGRPVPDGPVDGGPASTETSQRPTQANIDSYLGAADLGYSIAIGQGGNGTTQVDLGLMKLLDKNKPGDPEDKRYYNVVDADGLLPLFADIFTQLACPPHVTAQKTVTEATASPGDTLHYTIALANDGESNATGVEVHDNISELLAHGTFGTCDNECTHDADSVDWTGLTVNMGGSLTLHFTIVLAETGWPVGTTNLPNTVVVPGTNCAGAPQVVADPNCSTDTTVEKSAEPTLLIDKSVSGYTGGEILGTPKANIGDTLTYTLVYALTNGPVDGVTIEDVLPAGLGTPTNISDGGTYDATTRTITWDLGTIEDGGSVSYKILVAASAAEVVQPLVNVATIDSEQTDPDSDDASVGVAPPPLAETNAPTLPPTNTVDGYSQSEGSSLPMILGLLAILASMVLVITPSRVGARSRIRRK